MQDSGPVPPETLVPLVGAMNFRDVGGYPTTDGRIVRRGMVYRSDHLNELTEDDLLELSSRGIRTVIDLRHPREVANRPSRLWPGVLDHHHEPMGGELVQQKEFIDLVMSGEVTAITVEEVADSYVEMLAVHAEAFGRVLRTLADLDQVPAVYHCTAGKDRTGLTTALLHRLLGVSREDVLIDFELSNPYRAVKRVEQLRPTLLERGVDVEAIMPALSAPAEAMATMLDHLDGELGGVEAYLVGPARLDTGTLTTLREQLLVNPR